jgi:hypothetical protein
MHGCCWLLFQAEKGEDVHLCYYIDMRCFETEGRDNLWCSQEEFARNLKSQLVTCKISETVEVSQENTIGG